VVTPQFTPNIFISAAKTPNIRNLARQEHTTE
jgi:hypothetical protein